MEKLFYLLFRTTDESSIQDGGKVTITNSRIFFFSDRMDIFWLSVFVKLFKRKVKFRHNRLNAQPYNIYYYVHVPSAYACVDHIKSTSVFVSYIQTTRTVLLFQSTRSLLPRILVSVWYVRMLYRYVGLILPTRCCRGSPRVQQQHRPPSVCTKLYSLITSASPVFANKAFITLFFAIFICYTFVRRHTAT